jgi:hypothetical protein
VTPGAARVRLDALWPAGFVAIVVDIAVAAGALGAE